MTRLALPALLLLLLATSARADEIHLRNGKRLVGRVERETSSTVVIRMERGKLTLRRSTIAKIVRDTPAAAARPPSSATAAATPPEATSGGVPVDVARRSQAPAASSITLQEAVGRKFLQVEARGNGLFWVQLTLERLHPEASLVHVPLGTIFESPPPDPAWQLHFQDMVSVAGVNVGLPDDGKVKVLVPVCCADLRRHVPAGSHVFRIGRTTALPELKRVVAVLAEEEAQPLSQQAAVWIVTNNASYGAMGALRGPFTEEGRLLEVHHAAHGMLLCEKAGIDLSRKRIDKDDYVLVGALSDRYVNHDHPVRAWAMQRLRRKGFRGGTEGDLIADVLSRSKERKILIVACDVASHGCHPEAEAPLQALLDGTTRAEHAQEPRGGLREALLDDSTATTDDAIALWAAKALSAMGGKAPGAGGGRRSGMETQVEASLATLTGKAPGNVVRALTTLERLNPRGAPPALRRRAADHLLEYLEQTDGAHAQPLGRALVRYHDVLVPSDLTRAVEGKPPFARRIAAEVLGKIERLGATSALVDRLTDADGQVRTIAAKGLRGRQGAAQGLARLTGHTESYVRAAAMDLLLELEGPEVESALASVLSSHQPIDVERLIERVGQLRSRLAVVPLTRLMLHDTNPEIRRRAAHALGRIGTDTAATWLGAALRSEEDRRVRGAIQGALRSLGKQ